MEFLQASSLTTGVDEFTGNGADNTFNAPAVNETTGAATTTIGAGDTLDGGAGADTLNISVTASDNNSLAGLSVKNIEVVNITNSDFLGSGQGALADATEAAADAAATYAASQANETTVIKSLTAQAILADAAGGDEYTLNALESASSLATLEEYKAAAVALAADASLVDAGDEVATQLKLEALLDLTADEFAAKFADAIFSQAQYNSVIAAAQIGLNGVPIADDIAGENPKALTDAILNVSVGYDYAQAAVVVGAVGESAAAGVLAAVTALDNADEDQITILKTMTPATAAKIAAAYAAVDGLAAGGDWDALTEEPDAIYTMAQYNAALAAAKKGLDGEAITVGDATVTRAGELGTAATAAAAISEGVGQAAPNTYSTANLTTAIGLVTTDHDGATILTATADDSDAIAARQAVVKTTYTVAAGIAADYSDGLEELSVTSYSPATVSYSDLLAVSGGLTRTDLDDGLALRVELGDVEAGIADLVAARKATTTAKVAKIAADTAVDQIEVTAASVSASSFAGAEQVWFKGASGDTAISAGATQIIGFSGVTAMANAVTTAAVSPTFAISGSKGDLEVKGAKATSMNFIGTGGTVAPTLTTTGTNELLTVTSSTSGTLTLDLTALTDLEEATANGTGALSLQNSPTTLATITTGAGADKMGVNTATVEDDEDTDDIETVSAVVSTGAGNDTIVVKTTGADTTSVDSGAGNDTVILRSTSSGKTTIDLGDGTDTFQVGALSNVTTKTTISGGDGVDTLKTSEDTWSAADYLLLNSYISGFEKLVVTAADADIDASELSGFASIEFNNGDATITEVSGQTLVLGSAAKVKADTKIGLLASDETKSDDLTATALGYDNTDPDAIEFGGDLNIVATGVSVGAGADVLNILTLSGNAATITAAVGLLGEGATVPYIDVQGDLVSLTATLVSTSVVIAGAGVDLVTNFTTTIAADDLENLESIVVRGSGDVTINAGALAEDDAVLKTINVSGMTALAQIDGEGDATGVNLSKTSITGNANFAEEIMLGGAQDTVVATGSTAGAMDVVTGFALVATKSDAEVINAALSDKLVTGVDGADFVYDKEADWGSLNEALLSLGAAAEANHIFHADGNTYVYISAAAEYASDDVLVELTGGVDAVLLAQVISA